MLQDRSGHGGISGREAARESEDAVLRASPSAARRTLSALMRRLCARPLARSRRLAPALVALALAAMQSAALSQPAGDAGTRIRPAYSQVEVKAAFLYRFGSYVRWPERGDGDDSITIAVLNDPAIATELERFVEDRTIEGRRVEVRRLRSIFGLSPDDRMLFIGPDETGRLAQIIEAVGDKPILVVTDAPDGLADGAMNNFQVIERRVRFEISLTRARAAGLDLSSRLLAAAIKVETSRCAELCRGSSAKPTRLAEDSDRAAFPKRTAGG
jgi:hypothetical protein